MSVDNIYISTKWDSNNGPKQDLRLVSGVGTDLYNNPALKNRAKRKMITNKMVLSLIDVAKERGDSDRVKAYWNAFHCQATYITNNGKIYTNYCKNRFCTSCNSIRKAYLINKYLPEIKNWKDPQFVTLTVKAVKARSLNKWIKGMYRAFSLIHGRCKKRNQRGKGIKLIGVKSLECNFNSISKTYNPHFHIIAPTKEVADLLVKEWLYQWKNSKTLFTSPKAQWIRPVKDLEKDLVEIIKYGSKIFTSPELNKKASQKTPPMIYAKALDNIFTAMKGHRIFDRFGFNLPEQKPTTSEYKLLVEYKEWLFCSEKADWVNASSRQGLTGFLQPNELKHLLNDCINIENS